MFEHVALLAAVNRVDEAPRFVEGVYTTKEETESQGARSID